MAFTPPEEAGRVRSALAEIVAERGPDVLSMPAVLTSLLADLLPDAHRLVQLIAAAAQGRVADDLRGHVAQGMDAATAAALVSSSFATATLYTPGACDWVVTEFASALGMTTPTGQPQAAGLPAGAAPLEDTSPAGFQRPVPTQSATEPQPAPDVIRAAEREPATGMSPTRQTPGGDPGGAATVTAYPPAAGAPSYNPAKPAGHAGRQRESGVVRSDFSGWHPQISKRFLYIATYLIPVIGIGYIGIPILVILMIALSLRRPDRLFMMNAIQSLEICLIGGLVVAFGIAAYRIPAYSAFYGVLAGICGLLTISLLIFCIVKLAGRNQPRITVLSKIAFRLAYGRNSSSI